jgi:hypothetical protein
MAAKVPKKLFWTYYNNCGDRRALTDDEEIQPREKVVSEFIDQGRYSPVKLVNTFALQIVRRPIGLRGRRRVN